LAKHETAKDLPLSYGKIRIIKDGKFLGFLKDVPNNRFSDMKNNGVGGNIIVGFLGGNWKQWMVQEAKKSTIFSRLFKDAGAGEA